MSRNSRRSLNFDWLRWPITALTLMVVVAGLYIAINASLEQVRFSRAADQILSIVALARDASFEPASDPVDHGKRLFAQLLARPNLEPRPEPAGPYGFLMNPWQKALNFRFSPINFNTSGNPAVNPPVLGLVLILSGDMPVAACRHLLNFFGRDPATLDLWQIGVRPVFTDAASPRLLFDKLQGGGGELPPEAIIAGCGSGSMVNLNLIFRVR